MLLLLCVNTLAATVTVSLSLLASLIEWTRQQGKRRSRRNQQKQPHPSRLDLG
jgi:hypothetical protein